MGFARQISISNIKRKPGRTAAMAVLVMLLSFALFAGAYSIISLQRGLGSYQARLGADVIVTPNSSKGHGTIDDVLLQGITGNYYMSGKDCDKIAATEGIEQISKQFFLTSAKASCCSTRVQIIGFDPETDFTVMPWISEEYDGTIADGDLVVGSKINVTNDRTIKFYGQDYHVAAQLRETGTGLDSTVYTNMATMHQMASDAQDLFGKSMFDGVDTENGASAIMIKVADGYEISDVTDDINIHITKVQATSSAGMVSSIAEGLSSVSRIIGGLVIGIWVLAVVILIAAFAMLMNERKKEFAVLRVMGASQSMLSRIMSTEAVIISLIGGVLGVALAILVIIPLSGSIKDALELPFLAPGAGALALLACGAIAVSVLSALVTTLITSRRITNSETGLLLREDA